LASAVAAGGVALGGVVLFPVLTQGFCWDESQAVCASHQPSTAALVASGLLALALAVAGAFIAALIALEASAVGELGWWRLAVAGALLLPLVPLAITIVILVLGTPAADVAGHHPTAVAVFTTVCLGYLFAWRRLIDIVSASRRRRHNFPT